MLCTHLSFNKKECVECKQDIFSRPISWGTSCCLFLDNASQKGILWWPYKYCLEELTIERLFSYFWRVSKSHPTCKLWSSNFKLTFYPQMLLRSMLSVFLFSVFFLFYFLGFSSVAFFVSVFFFPSYFFFVLLFPF